MKFLDVEQGKMVDVSLEEFCERMGIKMPEPEKESTMKDPFGMMDAITDAADRETKRLEETAKVRYPECVVTLTGVDGNAFSVMAAVTLGLKVYLRGDATPSEIKAICEEFTTEAMSGSYDQLIQTCMKWVAVE